MLAAARDGRFEILIVGYASRFRRNVKQTLIAVEDHLQPAGVAVLFVDERLLSSDPDHWNQFVREVQEAEAVNLGLDVALPAAMALGDHIPEFGRGERVRTGGSHSVDRNS